jgi:transposase
MIINLLGIDIAKNMFQLHGIDCKGKAVLKKRLSRDKLAEYIANIPPCTIVMESCGGANYWARVFQRSGYTVKLISPQFVKPFVKNRTALINEIRGLNLEYGIAIPTGASKVRAELCLIISDKNNELTVSSREFMSDLYNELVDIEGKLKHLEKKVKQICRQNEACQRIMKIGSVASWCSTNSNSYCYHPF